MGGNQGGSVHKLGAAMLVRTRALIAACVLAAVFQVSNSQVPPGKPGFPKNAGPDGKPPARPSNLNPLMGAKSRRTGAYPKAAPPAAPDPSLAPPRPNIARQLLNRDKADRASKQPPAQGSRGAAPRFPDAPRPVAPTRSRFAAPVRPGRAGAPQGAARRVLSGAPSITAVGPQGAAGRVHSQFLSGGGPFASNNQGVFGITSGGAAPLRKPGAKPSKSRPDHLRYHGRAPVKDDDRPKMTLGAINNVDGSYSAEFFQENGVAYARDVQGSVYPEHKLRNNKKKQEEQSSVHEMVTMEAANYYEAAMGEMLYHLRLHNTHRTEHTGLLIVTTTLPQGSKPGHCYWIRNRRREPGERTEQHDCFIKRLTVTGWLGLASSATLWNMHGASVCKVTCRVHKLIPGQLATIYLHNK